MSRRTLVKIAVGAAATKTISRGHSASPSVGTSSANTQLAAPSFGETDERPSPRNLRVGTVGTTIDNDTCSLRIIDDSPRGHGCGVEVLRFPSTAAAVSALSTDSVDCFFDAARSTQAEPNHDVKTVIVDPRSARCEMIELCLSTNADGNETLHVRGGDIA